MSQYTNNQLLEHCNAMVMLNFSGLYDLFVKSFITAIRFPLFIESADGPVIVDPTP